MEILVLGTSATKPLPREGCRCPICVSKDKKDRRMRSSILIACEKRNPHLRRGVCECAHANVLIDCGPDIKLQIENCKLSARGGSAFGGKIENLKGIFITHAHQDHIAGLKKIVRSSLRADPRSPKSMSRENLLLYISKIDAKILGKKLLSQFRLKIIKPYQKIKINNLIFQPIPIIHPGSKSTFAFKVIRNKFVIRRVIYMPDYKRVPKKSLKYFKNIDLLIVGGSSLERKLPWHATIKETIDFFTRFGGRAPKKIYFTHIGHRTLPHRELVKWVKREGGKNFDICFDGQRIRV